MVKRYDLWQHLMLCAPVILDIAISCEQAVYGCGTAMWVICHFGFFFLGKESQWDRPVFFVRCT
jgi:hypothetical protein